MMENRNVIDVKNMENYKGIVDPELSSRELVIVSATGSVLTN